MARKIMEFSRDIPLPDMPPLVFFETSKQESRLVADEEGCYIELEDKDKGTVGRYEVKGSEIKVKPEFKETTGTVDIGNRRNWLYSKRLFLDADDLANQIRIRLEQFSEK